MLLAAGIALFCLAMVFYFRCWRAILRVVDACRADNPSQRYRWFWWIPAWKYHRRRWPESPLRRHIQQEYAWTWLFGGAGFALIMIYSLRKG